MSNGIDDLLKGGNKTAKFETIGQTWSGVITEVATRQATNFDSGKPEFWDDGNPKMQIVISLQTTERLDSDDDGVRSIYIKAWGDQKKALQRVAQEIGRSPQAGDHFTATYVGDGEKPLRGFAPKLYKYAVVPGNPLDAQLAAPVVQAPVAQQIPAQAQLNPLAEAQLQAATALASAVPATPAAVAAPVAPSGDVLTRATQLVNSGLTNEQILGVLDGVTVQNLETIRLQALAVAGAGAGF